MDRPVRLRPWLVICLVSLWFLTGSCGSSGSGGGGTVAFVGGTLPPNPIAYALTPTSDSLIGDEDDSDLPSFVDLRRDGVIPPVKNQRWNSCVAWTLGYYIMTAVEAQRQRKVNPAEFTGVRESRHWFSPDFIYSQRDDDTTREKVTGAPVHCVERDGELGCMRPEKALRILMTQGCCKWDWMCDDGSTDRFRSCEVGKQDDALRKSRRDFAPAAPGALRYRPRCFVRFGSLEKLPAETIESMKVWLADQRTPIAIVVKMSAGWLNYRGENRSTLDVGGGFVTDVLEERGVCLEAGGQDLLSQHMMTIIGYDDEFPTEDDFEGLPQEKEGSFLVINQWGDKWGDRGTMWIPYSELRKIWVGAYGIIGGDGTGNASGGVECAQDDEGRWVGLVECDDVPKNLDKDGVPRDTTNLLAPAPNVHTDQIGHTITDGTCLPVADGGVPRDARDTADWFHFITPGPNSRIELTLTGPGGGALTGDLDLRLIDAEQRHVASSLVAGTGGETLRRTICAAGRYLVKVFPKGPGDTSRYELTLTYRTDTPPQPFNELCGALSESLIAAGSETFGQWAFVESGAGFGKSGGDLDREHWWKFQAAERSRLILVGQALAKRVELWQGDTPDTARVAKSYDILWPDPASKVHPVAGLFPRPYFIETDVEPGECVWARFVDLEDFDAGGGLGIAWAPLSYLIQRHWVPRQGDDSEAGATPLEVDKQEPPLPDGTEVFLGSADPDTVEVGADSIDWYSLMMPPGGRLVVRIDAPGVADKLEPWINGGTSEATVRGTDSIVLTSVNPPADAQPLLFTIAVFAKQEGGAATYDYTLSVQAFVYPGDDTAGFTPGDLATLSLGRAVRGVIGGGDPKDHYRAAVPTIDPAAPEAWIISVTGFEQSQPPPILTMALWNGRSVPLTDDGSTEKEIRKRAVFAVGDDASTDVILGVCAPPGGVFSDYILRAWRVPVSTPSVDDNDTPPTADAVSAGASQGGSLAANDLLDYHVFRKDPDAAVGPVTVHLGGVTGAGAQVRLSVWDAAGVRRQATVAQGASGQVVVPGVAPGAVLTILVEATVPQPTPYQLTVTAP